MAQMADSSIKPVATLRFIVLRRLLQKGGESAPDQDSMI